MAKKRFTMARPRQPKKIMQQNKLRVSGLVDPGNAKKLGQIAGVDAIIHFPPFLRVAIPRP